MIDSTRLITHQIFFCAAWHLQQQIATTCALEQEWLHELHCRTALTAWKRSAGATCLSGVMSSSRTQPCCAARGAVLVPVNANVIQMVFARLPLQLQPLLVI